MDDGDRRETATQSWGDRLWAAVFVGGGLVVCVLLVREGVATTRDWLGFDAFAAVPATVVASDHGLRSTGTSVRHGTVHRNERWLAAVTFRYTWEGREREGRATVPSEDSEAAARAAAAALAPGATITVYVDPADPDRLYVAEERPSLGSAIAYLAVGGLGGLLCLGLVLAPLVRRRRPDVVTHDSRLMTRDS